MPYKTMHRQAIARGDVHMDRLQAKIITDELSLAIDALHYSSNIVYNIMALVWSATSQLRICSLVPAG